MSVLSFVNDINRSEMDSLKQDTAKIKRNVCKLTYGYHNFDDNGVCKNCGVTSVKIADGNTVHNALYSLSGTSTTEAMNLQLKIVDSTYNLKESYIRSTIDLSDSTTEQSEHVYAYLLNNNYQIYIKPTADIVICNKEMTNMFQNCIGLSDISALANWDASKVTNMDSMFMKCKLITDISALANWNISNTTDTQSMFQNCTSLSDISPLADWDTSNIKLPIAMFYGCTSLIDASCLENWDVSNFVTMTAIFPDTCTKLPSWYTA